MRRIDSDRAADGPEEGIRSMRLRYQKPEISERGRLVDVALGGSPGAGDSGAGAFIEDFPAG